MTEWLRRSLGDDPGLDDGELGVLDGEEEVHEEDDPRHDAQHPHSHTSISLIFNNRNITS